MPPSTSSNWLGVAVHQNDQTWVISVAAWSANWFAEWVELVIVVLPVQTHLLLESLKLIMHDSKDSNHVNYDFDTWGVSAISVHYYVSTI